MDYEDYVRAMAYGPSQNEFTHDTLYGPFGKLREGDAAFSPDLQKRYPLGSYAWVQPKEGEAFQVRVADHSYIKPGEPTKNTIELWNGQDIGHATISPSPAPTLTSPSRSMTMGVGAPVSGGSYASSGGGYVDTSGTEPYGLATSQGPSKTAQGIASIGSALGTILGQLGSSQQQQKTDPLALMKKSAPNLQYLAPVPYQPNPLSQFFG